MSEKLISKRRLPVNFDEKDLYLFAHELEKEIPAARILEFKDVTADWQGILFDGWRILPETFALPENFNGWKSRTIVKTYLHHLILKKRRSFKTPVLWATDDWSMGYYHWLCDVLPRIVFAADRLRDHVLMLPGIVASHEFVKSSLEMFGVEKVEVIGADEIVACNELCLPTHTAKSGDFNEEIIKNVRDRFRALGTTAGDAEKMPRVYISRRRAAKRKVLNEEEIVGILESRGFVVVCTEDYSFLEQIKLFSGVEYLISTHGAGLTNMLFMPEKSRVFEFRKFDDAVNNCYFNMASALDHEFYYQLCASDNNEQDAHSADLIVDAGLFEKNLERFLSRR